MYSQPRPRPKVAAGRGRIVCRYLPAEAARDRGGMECATQTPFRQTRRLRMATGS